MANERPVTAEERDWLRISAVNTNPDWPGHALKTTVSRLLDDYEAALALLERSAKYVTEDRAVTPGVTRLARLTVKVDAFLVPRRQTKPGEPR